MSAARAGFPLPGQWRSAWPLLALLALLAFNLLFTPGFATIEVQGGRLFGATIDILKNGSTVMLLATGMTLVIASGGIDLSVGSLMALSATAAALALHHHQPPAGVAIALGLAVGAAAGLANGALVTLLRLQPIIATLVMLVAGRGLAQTLTADQKVRFDAPAFESLGTGSVLGLPTPIILAAAAAAATLTLLRWTVLGMYLEAIGQSPRAAHLCGLPVRALRTTAYTVSGVCAALAGMIGAADIGEADPANAGMYLELDAILAVVIGGTPLSGGRPRLLGAIIGALIMQTLTVMLQMRGVITEHTLVIKAIVALAVCLSQAPGLAATARRLLARRTRA